MPKPPIRWFSVERGLQTTTLLSFTLSARKSGEFQPPTCYRLSPLRHRPKTTLVQLRYGAPWCGPGVVARAWCGPGAGLVGPGNPVGTDCSFNLAVSAGLLHPFLRSQQDCPGPLGLELFLPKHSLVMEPALQSFQPSGTSLMLTRKGRWPPWARCC